MEIGENPTKSVGLQGKKVKENILIINSQRMLYVDSNYYFYT